MSQGAQTRGGGIGASNQEIFEQGGAGLVQAFGGNNQACPIDVATARNACASASASASASGRMDFESETFIVQPAECITGAITHTLKADGFDASEDGTGRGTPLVPVLPFGTTQITSRENRANPRPGDPCHPLAAGAHAPAIAFDARQSDVIQYGEKTGPLDTNGSTMGVLAFQTRGSNIDIGQIAGTMGTNADRASGSAPMLMQAAAVRRLMPVECCRLQGFPDDYLSQVTWRGKSPPPDGPMYKALGNSWAVPNVAWIGRRIVAELERGNAA